MPRREALSKWALKSEAHDRRVKMLASGRAIEGIPVRPGELDRDPMLLNCRNGTLDLRTGDLRTHRREDYLTRGLDLDYDPDARCPTWELFLLQVFAGDVGLVEFLQRALGHSLTGDVREDSFFILQGGGGNGKSTLLYIVHGLLGAYAGRIPSELLMVRRGEHHPTEKATLYGKRFVSASETSEGCRLSEEMVKVLTSIDPIPCRRMREDYREFIQTHKLWLSTNHRPKIRGTDHAIRCRIRLIPFGVTFHEPETGKRMVYLLVRRVRSRVL
jgi:putative DNA primase/helicase